MVGLFFTPCGFGETRPCHFLHNDGEPIFVLLRFRLLFVHNCRIPSSTGTSSRASFGGPKRLPAFDLSKCTDRPTNKIQWERPRKSPTILLVRQSLPYRTRCNTTLGDTSTPTLADIRYAMLSLIGRFGGSACVTPFSNKYSTTTLHIRLGHYTGVTTRRY
jgi:hypothetical protein